MKTLDEIERAAYVAGNAEIANIAARLIEAETELEDCQEKLEKEFRNRGLRKSLYLDFFEECVYHLSGTWPGASIDDERLKGIIFDAIKRGEAGNAQN